MWLCPSIGTISGTVGSFQPRQVFMARYPWQIIEFVWSGSQVCENSWNQAIYASPGRSHKELLVNQMLKLSSRNRIQQLTQE